MFLPVGCRILGMEQERLSQLGETIAGRRRALGWATREQFAANIDLSYRVLTDLENGNRRLGPKAYAQVEEALKWKSGSIDSVLQGGEPTIQDDPLSQAITMRGPDVEVPPNGLLQAAITAMHLNLEIDRNQPIPRPVSDLAGALESQLLDLFSSSFPEELRADLAEIFKRTADHIEGDSTDERTAPATPPAPEQGASGEASEVEKSNPDGLIGDGSSREASSDEAELRAALDGFVGGGHSLKRANEGQ